MKKPPKKKHKKLAPLNPDAVFSKNNLIWLAVILLLTFIAYFPSLKDGFTNWDDNQYVTENALVKNFTLANIITHFSQFYMGHYHPFTMLSLMFDYLIGSDHPFIYHFTNVILHLVNTFFVFWLVFLITKKINITIIVAALFGLHTLHVESVTWISERKDVLYAFFFLASLTNYIRYIQLDKKKYFIYAILLFICSLFSKAQAVSLAGVIILFDYLYNRKLLNIKIILEKVPFIALALIFGYISMQADKTNLYAEGLDNYSWLQRILLASYSLGLYFWKLIFPLHLSNWYPYPFQAAESMPWWLWLFLTVPLIYLSAIIFTLKKNRFIAVSLLFFGLNIITMLQIFPIRDVIMADRYVYISSLGFFLLIGYLLNYLIEKKPKMMKSIRGGVLVYVLLLVILTNARASIWKDSLSLWEDTISKYPQVPIAHLNYGKALSEQNGKLNEAIQQYDIAIKLDTNFSIAYNNRGVAKDMKGEKESAILDYSKAISLNSDYKLAYSNRAMAKKDINDFKGALADINISIIKSPEEGAYYRNRGLIRMAEKKYKEALNDFSTALKYDPKLAYAWSDRGTAKYFLGDYLSSVEDYDKAIRYKKDFADAYFNRAASKMKLNETMSACGDLKKAADLGHENAKKIYSQHCQ